jgi:predicted nucleic acid-binding protein
VVLADTSVWVDFARRGRKGQAAGLATLLDEGDVSTCGPVVAELIAGSMGEVAERMWTTLSSLLWAEMTPETWCEVGAVAHRLRRDGQTLPLTDLAIAIAAGRAGHALWSFDSDFECVRSVMPDLELHRAS